MFTIEETRLDDMGVHYTIFQLFYQLSFQNKFEVGVWGRWSTTWGNMYILFLNPSETEINTH